MRVAATSDWRDGLAFDRPVLVADVAPGDPARCFTCGVESELVARDRLWAVKHRHPKHHGGFVRFYCAAHAPRPAVNAPASAPRRAPREATPRRPKAPEKQRAVCPDCFVEATNTGVCSMCGQQVA